MTPPSHIPEEAPKMSEKQQAAMLAWWQARADFIAAAVEHLFATRDRQGLPMTGVDAQMATHRETERAGKEFAWGTPPPAPVAFRPSARSVDPEWPFTGLGQAS